MGLPWCFSTKESASNAGGAADVDLIPQSGRSSGGGNDRSLQCSSLGNPMATRIQSTGSQRVGHDWSDWAHSFFMSFSQLFFDQILFKKWFWLFIIIIIEYIFTDRLLCVFLISNSVFQALDEILVNQKPTLHKLAEETLLQPAGATHSPICSLMLRLGVGPWDNSEMQISKHLRVSGQPYMRGGEGEEGERVREHVKGRNRTQGSWGL